METADTVEATQAVRRRILGELEKVKPPESRLREKILDNALEACSQPDAKRTQEWLVALQVLEQVEDMRRERKKPQGAKEQPGA